MSDPQDNKTARKRIADDVWCRTCDTVHIAYIPVTTFRCADCGFGQWDEDLAESHASAFPSHVVYSLVHEVEPPMTADPVRPQETPRERVAQALHDWRCLRACKGYEYHSEETKNFYRNEADGVLPIVEEETARQSDLIAEFRKRDKSASRVIRNAIRQAAEHGTDLAALRDKVKALASEERFDVAHHLAEIEPRDDLDKYILDCAIETVREIERRLRALVEEPQGGER